MKDREKVAAWTGTKKKKSWDNKKGDKWNGKVCRSVIVPGRVCALKHIISISQYAVRRCALVKFQSTHLEHFDSTYFWPLRTNVSISHGVASCPESTKVRSAACLMESVEQAHIWGNLGHSWQLPDLESGQHVDSSWWNFTRAHTSIRIAERHGQKWETRDKLNSRGILMKLHLGANIMWLGTCRFCWKKRSNVQVE